MSKTCGLVLNAPGHVGLARKDLKMCQAFGISPHGMLVVVRVTVDAGGFGLWSRRERNQGTKSR